MLFQGQSSCRNIRMNCRTWHGDACYYFVFDLSSRRLLDISISLRESASSFAESLCSVFDESHGCHSVRI